MKESSTGFGLIGARTAMPLLSLSVLSFFIAVMGGDNIRATGLAVIRATTGDAMGEKARA
jgi:hypothetical protein